MPFEDDPDSADTPEPKPKRKNYVYTIKNLELDLELARTRGARYLLPRGKEADVGSGKKYPLPTALNEIKVLAELPFKTKASDEGTAYLRRARRRLVKYSSRTSVSLDLLANSSAVHRTVDEVNDKARKAEAEIAAVVKGVQAEAVKAAASLTDLYGLARSHGARVLEAHLTGQPINGEVPTIDQATAAMKPIFTHVARMGGIIAPGEKEEAEDAIFQQFVEATKARLLKDVDGTEH